MTALSSEFNFKNNLFMTQEELNKVLDAHKHYLAQDCEEWQNMRADLRNADLSDADLRNADLSDADLSGAYLCGADLSVSDLRNANLSGADLGGADIRNANISSANLSDADLSGANLSGAYLRNAYLRDAYLSSANLMRAYLSGADLCGADLSDANLSGANLSGANLGGADLSGANLGGASYNEDTAFFALLCPEEGDFVAWKKVGKVIVKIRVPAEAKRSSATTRKCRCEFAEVLELQNLDGTPYEDDKVVNSKYKTTIYKVGEIVHPDSWDDDRWNECSHGIHFFITRDEALRYQP